MKIFKTNPSILAKEVVYNSKLSMLRLNIRSKFLLSYSYVTYLAFGRLNVKTLKFLRTYNKASLQVIKLIGHYLSSVLQKLRPIKI